MTFQLSPENSIDSSDQSTVHLVDNNIIFPCDSLNQFNIPGKIVVQDFHKLASRFPTQIDLMLYRNNNRTSIEYGRGIQKGKDPYIKDFLYYVEQNYVQIEDNNRYLISPYVPGPSLSQILEAETLNELVNLTNELDPDEQTVFEKLFFSNHLMTLKSRLANIDPVLNGLLFECDILNLDNANIKMRFDVKSGLPVFIVTDIEQFVGRGLETFNF